MSRRERRTWQVFAACVAAGVAVMVWLTLAMLRLERGESEARADVAHRNAIGTALWRMDSWLAPQLAREAAREPREYLPFFAQQQAYTRVLHQIAPGEVLSPSPLLEYRSDLIPLHFQIDADGKLSSPQVPTGNALDIVQARDPSFAVDDRRRLLEEIGPRVCKPDRLNLLCDTVQSTLPDLNPVSPMQAQQNIAAAPSWIEYQNRAQSTTMARNGQAQPENGGPVTPGPLLPVWLGEPDGADRLVFVRRVRIGQQAVFQGFVADWPKLRAELLAQITDLVDPEQATLRRVDAPDVAEQSRMLSTVPAVLDARRLPPALPDWSSARTVIVAAWLALLMAGVIAGVTLRSTLTFGARRARFASAVTHELRTPLTTFRMYSEMLAEDMVREPAQRKSYLQTLRGEADRLSRLVENVLSYARIEDGRHASTRERTTAVALLGRITPLLEERARAADMELVVASTASDAELETDPDAIAQILFNLVENACKYAAGSEPARIELELSRDHGQLRIAVRDHGPGVPTALRRRVFEPFDRGAREAGDNETPGIGLGLALARELAQDLGGDLVLEDAAPGARFVLRVPLARTS